MNGASRRTRTLSADKPCRVCGTPIHYTYVGPVEGVCGRCSDKGKRRRKSVRPYHRGMVVGQSASRRRSTASTVVLLSVVMVGGAVAVAFVLGRLLG